MSTFGELVEESSRAFADDEEEEELFNENFGYVVFESESKRRLLLYNCLLLLRLRCYFI